MVERRVLVAAGTASALVDDGERMDSQAKTTSANRIRPIPPAANVRLVTMR